MIEWIFPGRRGSPFLIYRPSAKMPGPSPAITTSSVRMGLSVSINLRGKLLLSEISVPIFIK
jgi:hypothetical protein